MAMTYHRYLSTIMLIVLIVFAAGCSGDKGPRTYKVEGTVTLNDSPLEGASVSFYPASTGGVDASAKTDASGKYSLYTAGGKVGTTPGTYAVVITKRESVSTGKKITSTNEDGSELVYDETRMEERLPVEYTKIQTTPYKEIQVEAKKLNTVDLEVKQ